VNLRATNGAPLRGLSGWRAGFTRRCFVACLGFANSILQRRGVGQSPRDGIPDDNAIGRKFSRRPRNPIDQETRETGPTRSPTWSTGLPIYFRTIIVTAKVVGPNRPFFATKTRRKRRREVIQKRFGCVLNELALAGRTGRVNSGSLGASPLLCFLPRFETGGGGNKEGGFDGADGRPSSTGKLDGGGRHLIPFRYSPPQAGEMKRGMAVGQKSPTSVGEYCGETPQPKKDTPKKFYPCFLVSVSSEQDYVSSYPSSHKTPSLLPRVSGRCSVPRPRAARFR